MSAKRPTPSRLRTLLYLVEVPKAMYPPLISQKASRFTESVIRGMTVEARKHGAINLAQGMPDFAAPREIKAAACRAIEDDINQYAITWGRKNLREAVAENAEWHLGLRVDPETEITRHLRMHRGDAGDIAVADQSR